jgi:hypothetical protein
VLVLCNAFVREQVSGIALWTLRLTPVGPHGRMAFSPQLLCLRAARATEWAPVRVQRPCRTLTVGRWDLQAASLGAPAASNFKMHGVQGFDTLRGGLARLVEGALINLRNLKPRRELCIVRMQLECRRLCQ